jgi:predicted transcriptional regulator
MQPLTLPPELSHALDDLADATGRRPEGIALDAVRAGLRAEEARVRGAAERLAGAHADLLRRLGE